MLLLRELDRQIAAYTQAALLARAMGADVAPPDPVEIRATFDARLAADPAADDDIPTDRTELLREAFGLTGG